MERRPHPRIAPPPLERDIQSAVVDHWKLLGQPNTLVAAIPNQNAHGQPGLTPGLADLLVMGEGIPGAHPIGFIELKRDHSRTLSDAQRQFRQRCDTLGLMFVTAYGRDEPIEVLEAWNVVRRQAA
jgi:hypothetical protein